MPKVNKSGFTLLEALIVIAIIGILSIFYVVNLRPDTLELLRMDTTRLAADIRYVRSMASSRVSYNGSFPSEGYGILFHNGAGTADSWYKLYAGNSTNPANILKTVTMSNMRFRLIDPNNIPSEGGVNGALADTSPKKIIFKSDNNVTVEGFDINNNGDYQVEIYYDFVQNGAPYYYAAKLNIGRQTSDEFVWSNLAITYDTNTPECGNGIVETGENCERVLLDGTIDDNCIPAGHSSGLGCKFNSCGDGVIAGTETCEKNSSITNITIYDNYCENLPRIGWCYSCNSMSGVTPCKNVQNGDINCCPVVVGNQRRSCTDCQWKDSNCFVYPRICPAYGGGGNM